jgi:hypothetical protein
MKTEPELIDIFAMFIVMALKQKLKVSTSNIDVAYEAYEQAQAMLDVREDFIHRRGD